MKIHQGVMSSSRAGSRGYDECGVAYAPPSMGLTLVFATLGFGADRFYVGEVGLGIALLIMYLSVFGAIIGIPVSWLSSLSLVIAILTGRNTAFMYSRSTVFAPANSFDKIMAILWIVFTITMIILFSILPFI